MKIWPPEMYNFHGDPRDSARVVGANLDRDGVSEGANRDITSCSTNVSMEMTAQSAVLDLHAPRGTRDCHVRSVANSVHSFPYVRDFYPM